MIAPPPERVQQAMAAHPERDWNCDSCVLSWEVYALRQELGMLKIRVDLDALGDHQRCAVELVEKRAEVVRLREQLEVVRDRVNDLEVELGMR